MKFAILHAWWINFLIFPYLYPLQVVAVRDIIPLQVREIFNDVYIAYELMDTDLHQINSSEALSEEHCQVLFFALQ